MRFPSSNYDQTGGGQSDTTGFITTDGQGRPFEQGPMRSCPSQLSSSDQLVKNTSANRFSVS